MYRLEITTADQRETLIKIEDHKKENDLTKAINYYKSLKLENIYIQCYEILENNDIIYLGRFDNITPGDKKTSKKIKISNIIIIIEFLLFPIMLIKEITKRY